MSARLKLLCVARVFAFPSSKVKNRYTPPSHREHTNHTITMILMLWLVILHYIITRVVTN